MPLLDERQRIDIDICQAVSVMGIVLHDMPQNRFAADLDHGFDRGIVDVRAERAQAIIYLIFLIFSSSLSCA